MSTAWLNFGQFLTAWQEGCAMNGAMAIMVKVHAEDGADARVSLGAKFEQGTIEVTGVGTAPDVAAVQAIRIFSAKRAMQLEGK